MIARLIAFCFHRRGVVFAVMLLTLGYGYYASTQLAIEAYPELSDVTAQVTTQAPGLAAEEVEQQITTPIERALAGVPGLVSMRSSSSFGLSLITMTFSEGSEDYWVRSRIREQLENVTLPAGVSAGLDAVTGPAGEIYRYTLESPSKNLMQLSELQRWTVIPALQKVPGVAAVNNFGGFTKEYQLTVDPDALQRYGVGMNDVIAAMSANNANAGGGRISRGEQSYVLRGIGLVRTLDAMGAIVVSHSNGVPVMLRDLGQLSYGHQTREGILGKDGNPDAIEGIVDMLLHENASRVLQGIHTTVDELNRKLAAEDVRIVPYIDRDDLVQATVHKVEHTVIEGVGLVCIVLILFLGSPRSALIAAVTIPFSLVVVFILMHLTHTPANLFSLGAIDFGVIVDGAIVVTETILRRREADPEATLTPETVLDATGKVARPIFFATLIIITAYAPLLAFEHAEGKLFAPMAYTVGFALIGALVTTLVLVPSLAYMAFRRPRKIFHNRPLERLQDAYGRALKRLIGRPSVAVIIVVAALVCVVSLGASVGQEFLPELDEGGLWVQVQLPSGLSLEKASSMASQYRDAVREFPEVSYVVTQLGRNDDGTDPWTPSHIESGVGLKPYDSWPHGETKAQFITRLNRRLQAIPGISVGISQPIIDGENDKIGGAHSPLVLRIYGDDFRELRRIGDAVVGVLKGLDGTADASVFQEPPVPQVAIEIDREAAARYGINVSDVDELIQTALGGAPVSQVYVDDRVYNMTAKVSRDIASSPDKLGALTLRSAEGAQIPLSSVTRIREQSGEATVAHEMGERNLIVRIDNRGRALSDYLADADRQIAAKVTFDKSRYRLQWGGQFENQRRAQSRLALALVMVLAVMTIFLFSEFGRLRQAALVLGVVPLAAVGGLIAITVRGETLNIATAVGFIALFGVAVQNGVIMVSNFNRVREKGASVEAAVLAGATQRFRPVLMTATVATAGMLPAALATGIGTDVQRGLATVVVGGLGIATLLTLFVLPSLYCLIEERAQRRAARSRSIV
ncbi:cobalt-zinc-cadmium resistance protein CzcA [Luteibacter sp. 1214]|uniref:efflux RND transporter permease subunit n=1 Tax=Luteibacter sp. 1214 TaxID=2817735 RepID=UPI00285BCE35|nr:CusA/CzcA family heavy metal efflux RND transporter [Luteibacter sp. 1214]MDR6641177.1 cobalt-zinc-cadmium resistance protein CzcA [Luteibacter sp. 1214]